VTRDELASAEALAALARVLVPMPELLVGRCAELDVADGILAALPGAAMGAAAVTLGPC
jgi:hypothetical protein